MEGDLLAWKIANNISDEAYESLGCVIANQAGSGTARQPLGLHNVHSPEPRRPRAAFVASQHSVSPRLEANPGTSLSNGAGGSDDDDLWRGFDFAAYFNDDKALRNQQMAANWDGQTFEQHPSHAYGPESDPFPEPIGLTRNDPSDSTTREVFDVYNTAPHFNPQHILHQTLGQVFELERRTDPRIRDNRIPQFEHGFQTFPAAAGFPEIYGSSHLDPAFNSGNPLEVNDLVPSDAPQLPSSLGSDALFLQPITQQYSCGEFSDSDSGSALYTPNSSRASRQSVISGPSQTSNPFLAMVGAPLEEELPSSTLDPSWALDRRLSQPDHYTGGSPVIPPAQFPAPPQRRVIKKAPIFGDQQAVVTTQKNPFQLLSDIGITSNGPCIKCWMSRKQCSGGAPCPTCAKSKPAIPAELCLRLRFTDCAVFSKWKEPSYKAKLLWPSLNRALTIKKVKLRHERGGPIFEAECCPFLATSPDHVQLYWKERGGWKSMETTAYTLKDVEVNLTPYVEEYITFFALSTEREVPYLGPIFALAMVYRKNPVVHLALHLWAASRLLTNGWEIHAPEIPGTELLGMHVVDNLDSPLYGTVPAPRVVQNQLDSSLEVHVAQTESKLLTKLEQGMKKRQRGDWVSVFLAVTIVLHALERDTWRLMYWLKHQAAANKWRHPSKPVTLVEKSVYFTNVLLAHFGIAGQGLSPLQLDWNQARNIEKVDNNAEIVESMKKLQLHTKTLKETFPLDRKGRDRYDELDHSSIDLSLSARCLMQAQSTDSFAELSDLVYY